MRVGKTRIGLQYLDHFYRLGARKFLIVAPKVSIFDSWREEAMKAGLEYLLEEIEFTTYLSLPKQDTDYSIIVLDECHSLLHTHEDYLDTYKGRILGLTGTPPRYAKSEKGYMVKKFCPVVFTYEINEAVDRGILNDFIIEVHLLDLSEDHNILIKARSGKTFYTSEAKSYEYQAGEKAKVELERKEKEGEIEGLEQNNNLPALAKAQKISKLKKSVASLKAKEQWNNIAMMRTIMGFRTKVDYAKRLLGALQDKSIVFCNTTEQADFICTHSYHIKNPLSKDNLAAFKSGSINNLGCVLQLSEGITIPNLKSGILLHSYGNERKASQRIGRMLGLSPNEMATIYILCYKDTIDEKWVHEALKGIDESRVKYYNVKNSKYVYKHD